MVRVSNTAQISRRTSFSKLQNLCRSFDTTRVNSPTALSSNFAEETTTAAENVSRNNNNNQMLTSSTTVGKDTSMCLSNKQASRPHLLANDKQRFVHESQLKKVCLRRPERKSRQIVDTNRKQINRTELNSPLAKARVQTHHHANKRMYLSLDPDPQIENPTLVHPNNTLQLAIKANRNIRSQKQSAIEKNRVRLDRCHQVCRIYEHLKTGDDCDVKLYREFADDDKPFNPIPKIKSKTLHLKGKAQSKWILSHKGKLALSKPKHVEARQQAEFVT